MTDIGNSLREARIRKGLSIKDVEDVTKIRSKYLEALEEDDYEVLPGPTYVKAFLRTYATFLKLDPDALVEEYRSDYEPRKEESGVIRTEVTRQPRTRTSTERKKQRVRRNQRSYAVVGIIAVVVVFLLAWFGSGRGQDAASIDASNITSSTTGSSSGILETTTTGSDVIDGVTSTSEGSDGETGTTTDTESTAENSTVTTSGENVVLVVTVSEGSCWLVVREDSESGADIYAGTLSAGGQQTFDSSKRYWMRVGRPEVLLLSVNDIAYSLTAPEGVFIVTEAGVERSD